MYIIIGFSRSHGWPWPGVHHSDNGRSTHYIIYIGFHRLMYIIHSVRNVGHSEVHRLHDVDYTIYTYAIVDLTRRQLYIHSTGCNELDTMGYNESHSLV